MGWLCYDIYTSPKQECDRILNYKSENAIQEVLASYMKGNVYYAVVHQKTEKRDCNFAAVFLTYYSPKATNGCNFGYKDMDESMGPCRYDFPEKYLDMLTPTNNELALEWRKAVRERISKNKKLAKLKVGDKIKFRSPVETVSGVGVGDEIIVEKRKRYFIHSYWRWPKHWIPKEFEIIKKQNKNN